MQKGTLNAGFSSLSTIIIRRFINCRGISFFDYNKKKLIRIFNYTLKIYTNLCPNWQKRNSPRGLFLFQQFVNFLAEVGVVFLQPSGYKESGKQAGSTSE